MLVIALKAKSPFSVSSPNVQKRGSSLNTQIALREITHLYQ